MRATLDTRPSRSRWAERPAPVGAALDPQWGMTPGARPRGGGGGGGGGGRLSPLVCVTEGAVSGGGCSPVLTGDPASVSHITKKCLSHIGE